MLSIFKMAAVHYLGFSHFCNICQKFQICAYLCVDMPNLVKIGQSTSELLHIFDIQNGGHPPNWILIFLQYLLKIQTCAYFYIDMQNLVKIV